MRGQYSMKLDVYSFGVLVLEIITGRRNFGSYGSDHVVDLIYVVSTWTQLFYTELTSSPNYNLNRTLTH